MQGAQRTMNRLQINFEGAELLLLYYPAQKFSTTHDYPGDSGRHSIESIVHDHQDVTQLFEDMGKIEELEEILNDTISGYYE